GGTIVAKRSNRLTISVVLPGREQFSRCIGSSRHRYVVYQNVGWIALQSLGPCICAEVNSDDETFLLVCGMLGALVGECIECFDAVHTAAGVRLRIVHYLGQAVDATDDVLLD